ncbi:MAG: hypothetical protein E3J92_01280 [Dehalococcoidia bacterium]|nr:MAG: hypothetical protein E3J92_01280 [Dehalococcoidia bacterium]
MWLKRILISIGILAAVGGGGFILYSAAYVAGDAAGYDEGYLAGQKIGYIMGNQDGYTDGFALGKDEGYGEGYGEGETVGYDTGYAEGLYAGTGHGYCLADPTYAEAVDFLRRDRTDWNRYKDDSYVCSHFSRDVCNNAEAEGWRCAFVELRYSDLGHSIIAFDTIDRGLVYFEPQFDDEVRVELGRRYSQLNDYVIPYWDDVIRDILVIW